MGLKPVSPSANFLTYNLPPSRESERKHGAFGHRGYSFPRSKGNISTSLFRFLFCSRPCFRHAGEASLELDEDDLDHDEDLEVRMELQAAMRHLEVRWELFGEALSRFGDLEAMLAICADKVRWRHYTDDGVKEAQISAVLKSLISRKLSMEVSINSISKLSSASELGVSINRDEYEGQQLDSKDGLRVQAALDLFKETRKDMGSASLRSSRLFVLEQDSYTLCNQRGQVVEEGKQLVIWEQFNATWYIRGCVSFPSLAI